MIPLEMYRAGRSYAEIGAALGLSRGQVAKAIYNARRQGDDLDVPRQLRGKEFTSGDVQTRLGISYAVVRGLMQRLHNASVVEIVCTTRTGQHVWRVIE